MMEGGSKGLARSKEPPITSQNNQASPKTSWTFLDHSSHFPHSLSARATLSVEHSPHVSHQPPYPIHWDGLTWTQLLQTTTWPYLRRGRVQGGADKEPQMSWMTETAPISAQVKRIPRKQ